MLFPRRLQNLNLGPRASSIAIECLFLCFSIKLGSGFLCMIVIALINILRAVFFYHCPRILCSFGILTLEKTLNSIVATLQNVGLSTTFRLKLTDLSFYICRHVYYIIIVIDSTSFSLKFIYAPLAFGSFYHNILFSVIE